jgi:hypothetical protein
MAAPVSPTDPQFITKAFWDAEIYARWVDLYADWTSYTPTWTCSTSNPSLGNGTLVGAYKLADTAKTLYLRLRLTAGSSTTFGSGAFQFTLPSGLAVGSTQTIGGYIHDNSTLARYPVSAIMTPSTAIERVAVNSGVGVTGAVPFTWAQSDTLLLTGVYEIS